MLKGKLTPTHFLQGTISKTADVVGSNIQPITIRKNGTYEASNGVDGFSPIYVNTPEPKEEQEKTVDIVENGTVEVFPDNDTVLSRVTINTNVPDTSDIIEGIIDESGVLEGTDGNVTKKVEQLLDLSKEEKMWIALTESKNKANYFFSGITAPKLPKTNFINATDFTNFCDSANIQEIDYYINSRKGTGFVNAFYGCKAKTIKGINLESATGLNNMFRSALVETIEEPLNVGKVTNFGTPFWQCSTIKNIRFVDRTIHYSIPFAQSSKLSAESVQSIIDGLATVTTAQTLTLNSAITLTDEQKATIKGKGWTLVQ